MVVLTKKSTHTILSLFLLVNHAYSSITCGCPSDVCTSEILNSYAGQYTCGARITYLIDSLGYSELDACRKVSGEEFPCACGPQCDPDRCNAPRTVSPTLTPVDPPSSLYCFPNDDGVSRITYANMWENDYIVQVKEGYTCGPGDNRFSRNTVSTDNDELTLQFKKNGSVWEASEVRIIQQNHDQQPFRYGNYTFHVKSVAIKNVNTPQETISSILPSNLVLGLFTWDPTDRYDVHQNWNHEVDIEISQWGSANSADAQFLVQPPGDPQMHRFYSGSTSSSYQQSNQWYSFRWLPNALSWFSTAGGVNGQSHSYSTEYAITQGCADYVQCLPADVEIRINLWNMSGMSVAPTGLNDDEYVEVIIDNFIYEEAVGVKFVEPGDYCSKHCQCEASQGCVNGRCIDPITMSPSTTTSVEPSSSPSNERVDPITVSPTFVPSLSPVSKLVLTATPTSTESGLPTVLPMTSPPTPISTTLPTTTAPACIDSPLRFKTQYKGKIISRRCVWVANKFTSRRCELVGVSAMCPGTCEQCNVCLDNPLRFRLWWDGKVITRQCSWVANLSTTKRCSAEGVAESCRSTCKLC